MSDDDLMEIFEARRRLGVNSAKMAKLVRSGLFPVYKGRRKGEPDLVRWSEVFAGVQKVPRILKQTGWWW